MGVLFSFSTVDSDPALRPWIRGCWEFTVSEGAPIGHHVPPDGLAFVVLVDSVPGPAQLLAFGPRVTPLVVPTRPGAAYRGLRLPPDTAPLLLDLTAAELVRRPVPIDKVGAVQGSAIISALGASSLADARQAIDNLFLPVVHEFPSPDPFVTAALHAIRNSGGLHLLSDVARNLGASPRTLLRRVRTATGLTPKQHARIARFYGAALELMEPETRLSQIAVRKGYSDQPHLTHEFTSLTGLTPAQLAERVRQTVHRIDG